MKKAEEDLCEMDMVTSTACDNSNGRSTGECPLPSQKLNVVITSCVSCHAESPKYKCPKCFLKYCSIGCCQSHKTDGTCMGKVTTSVTSKLSPIALPSTGRIVGGANDLDDPYERLIELLGSPSLRNWIKKLDDCSARDVPCLYETAMEDPEFVKYAQLIAKLRRIDDAASDSSED